MAEYIKREDALDAWYDKERYTDIEAIPSADVVERPLYERALSDVVRLSVERKKGKWIWDDEGYHCSGCWFHAYGNTLECMDGTYKYCPNCGAEMEGE